MDELIAKDVEPVEHEAQDLDGIPRPQGSRESTLRGPESFLPVFVPADSVVVLPERVEHKAVVQKHADGSREVVPYGVVHALNGIEGHHLSEVARERGPLRGRRVVELLLIRIGRVEGYPQEDEPTVVIGCVFGPSDPANRSVHAQAHCFRKSGAQFPLLGLQDRVRQGHWRGTSVSSRQPARPRPANLAGTLAPAPREIQMGRIATVLEAVKPERRAALEHETVAVVQHSESGNDVGQHVIPFHCRCRYTVARRLPSDLRPIGH